MPWITSSSHAFSVSLQKIKLYLTDLLQAVNHLICLFRCIKDSSWCIGITNNGAFNIITAVYLLFNYIDALRNILFSYVIQQRPEYCKFINYFLNYNRKCNSCNNINDKRIAQSLRYVIPPNISFIAYPIKIREPYI